jgi:pimeloyl-ACP methyl ester carboxylesterase
MEDIVTVESPDGTRIAAWKTGAGPSLVVVHGGAADHTAWDKVMPLLTDSFTVYAVDRRGRGASGDGASYAIEREFEDVAAVADALPGPVHLYGHSFGGICAVEGALRSGNLGSLILYEGSAKPPGLRPIPDEFIARLEQLIGAGDGEEALSVFMMNGPLTPEELEVYKRHPSWTARVHAAHTIPRELRAFNDYGADLSRLQEIDVPVLLIVGSETDERRRQMLQMFEMLVDQFKDTTVAVLPGQRHAAHETAPELLASTLREFLSSLSDRSPMNQA